MRGSEDAAANGHELLQGLSALEWGRALRGYPKNGQLVLQGLSLSYKKGGDGAPIHVAASGMDARAGRAEKNGRLPLRSLDVPTNVRGARSAKSDGQSFISGPSVPAKDASAEGVRT